MALERKVIYRGSWDEFGKIVVQEIEQILEEGEVHSEKHCSHVVNPGDTTTNEDAVTKEIAKVVHTPEVIATHEARMAELENA